MQINIYHKLPDEEGNGGRIAMYTNVKYCEVLENGTLYFTHFGENGLESIQTNLPYKIITTGDVKPY